MLAALFDPFLTLLYPPRCLVCKTLGERGLCTECAGQITPVAAPFCTVCGQTLIADDGGCADCRRRQPAFVRARSLGAYDGVLRHAIHQFKYRDRPQLAVPLGHLLAAFARQNAPALNGLRFDALLAVPMHPVRQRLRGYNQSVRLAQVVGNELGLPLSTEALVRIRPTRPQVGLSAEARRTNLRGAFAVEQAESVAGKTLLLIDDVVTSGSSLYECSVTLKAAGASAVYALTLAAG
jgi:competence protein ComFC